MSANPWSIRRLREDDWELMRAVRLAMLLDAPSAYGSTFARERTFTEATWRERAGPPVFHAVRDDGLPLGSATLFRDDPAADPEIVAMWVAGHARGHGIADALVGACLERAAAEGAGRVGLHVMGANAPAVALYRRLGFALDGHCGHVPGCSRMSRRAPARTLGEPI